MAKIVTTTVTDNPNEYLVTVNNDGVIHSFITTDEGVLAGISIYEAGIISNKDQLDTYSQVNGQVVGEFLGENGAGNYEYKLDKKYGNMNSYFQSGQEVTLYSQDPETPPFTTTVNSSYYSQDGVDEYGNAIYTTKLTLAADISLHEWYLIIK